MQTSCRNNAKNKKNKNNKKNKEMKRKEPFIGEENMYGEQICAPEGLKFYNLGQISSPKNEEKKRG